jgi:hypothetical protein
VDHTYVDLGRAACARIYPEEPELQVMATTAQGVVRFEVKGAERIASLAHGIFAALGIAPEGPADTDMHRQLLVARERIESLEGALDLAGKQMEEAQAEVRRLAEAKPRTRKPKATDVEVDQTGHPIPPPRVRSPEEAAKEQRIADLVDAKPADDHPTEEALVAMDAVIEAMDPGVLPGTPVARVVPQAWLELRPPALEVGERVSVLLADDAAEGGYATHLGTVETVFPGAEQVTVALDGRAPAVYDLDRVKAAPPAEPPAADDPERFLTLDERKAFIQHTQKLGLEPEKVRALMEEHLGISTSDRLTPAKRDTLNAILLNLVAVPF